MTNNSKILVVYNSKGLFLAHQLQVSFSSAPRVFFILAHAILMAESKKDTVIILKASALITYILI